MYGFFFFKQKTAYEMRISDWSSDVCSSDLLGITNLHMGDGNLPWTEKSLGARMKALEKGGVKLFAQMISGFPNAIYGRPDRDKDKIGRASCRERGCQYV